MVFLLPGSCNITSRPYKAKMLPGPTRSGFYSYTKKHSPFTAYLSLLGFLQVLCEDTSSLCPCTLLTMSLSSRLLCDRPGVPAGAPFSRLCCVNRMFMVASSTSDRLWRTCALQRICNEAEAAEWRHNSENRLKRCSHLVAEVPESGDSLLYAVLAEREKL